MQLIKIDNQISTRKLKTITRAMYQVVKEKGLIGSSNSKKEQIIFTIFNSFSIKNDRKTEDNNYLLTTFFKPNFLVEKANCDKSTITRTNQFIRKNLKFIKILKNIDNTNCYCLDLEEFTKFLSKVQKSKQNSIDEFNNFFNKFNDEEVENQDEKPEIQNKISTKKSEKINTKKVEKTKEVLVKKSEEKTVEVKSEITTPATKVVNKQDDCTIIIDYYNQKFDKNIKYSNKNKNDVKRALSIYSVDEVKQAIDACGNSSYHMGNNDNNKKYNSLELITRVNDKTDKIQFFIEKYSKNENQENSKSLWTEEQLKNFKLKKDDFSNDEKLQKRITEREQKNQKLADIVQYAINSMLDLRNKYCEKISNSDLSNFKKIIQRLAKSYANSKLKEDGFIRLINDICNQINNNLDFKSLEDLSKFFFFEKYKKFVKVETLEKSKELKTFENLDLKNIG